MELKELLEFVYKVQPKHENDISHIRLEGDILKNIKEELMKTKVFAKTNLHIIDKPTIKLSKGSENRTFSSENKKLHKDAIFEGDFYLHSIYITPKMYTPIISDKFDGRDAMVTPNMYNSQTFEPYKYIVMKWNPERGQDVSALNNTYELRNSLHHLLDDVLDSLEMGSNKFLQKSKRDVMIRGIWDSYTGSGEAMSLLFD